jgi:WD40 repeat protein
MKKYLYRQCIILLIVLLGNAAIALPQTGRVRQLQPVPGATNQPFQNPAVEPAATRNAQATDTAKRPELQVQVGHSSGINAVAFSPDGRFAVTGANDGFAILWSTETGAAVHRFTGHEWMVKTVAVSPKSSRFVATGSIDNTARIWDLATAKQLLVYKEHTSIVYGVAFSPDERLMLTGSADNTAKLWERETGKTIRVFQHPGTVMAVAYAADGQRIVTACEDGFIRLWDLSSNAEPQLFKNPAGRIESVALFTDSSMLAACGGDNVVRVWNLRTAAPPQEWQGHTAQVISLAFSADGRQLLSASWDGTARIWDTATGRQLRILSHRLNKDGTTYKDTTVAAFSSDGQKIITGGRDNTALLWDAESGQLRRRFQGNAFNDVQSAVSPDGRWLAVEIGGGYVTLWDLSTGQQTRFLGKETSFGFKRGLAFAFTADSRYLALAAHKTVQLWDVNTGQAVQEFPNLHSDDITSIAFSSDGKFFLTGSWDKTAGIWNCETGAALTPPLAQKYPVHAVAISPDNSLVLTGNGDDSVMAMFVSTVNAEPPCEALLWKATSGEQVRKFYHPFRFDSSKFNAERNQKLLADKEALAKYKFPEWDDIKGKVSAVAFSSDGKLVVTGNDNGQAHLWKTDTGVEVQHFTGTLYVKTLALTPDNKRLLMGCFNQEISIFDVATGNEEHTLQHPALVQSATLMPDGRYALTHCTDQTTRLWDVETGKEVCRLISLYYGDWVVVTPEGRFDANDLEEIRGLHWKTPDDPLNPLPLEIFMRDYYEPRLLTRLLQGEKFAAIPDVSRLNRAQPGVKVMKIEPSGEAPDLVNVTVEVEKGLRAMPDGTKMQTGVYDLRLFRDGQLIASEPQSNDELQRAKLRPNVRETLSEWRDRTAVKLNADNRALITFKNIHLPHDKGNKKIRFTAYAFNEDRVKSLTAVKDYELATPLVSVPKRVYLITIGVNAYESPVKDLTYAAKDARRLNEELFTALEKTGNYAEIIRVSLLSDRQGSSLTDKTATRANIRAVFHLLAGKPVAPEIFRNCPDAMKLQGKPARPEDVVIISFSGHGEIDGRGNFYLLPYDIGRGHGEAVTDRLLASSISSLELSEWVKDIDAGEMVMIVDACHSAAAVNTADFKPGPMGSRGLGQLAFDKKMKILAATQPGEKTQEKGGSRLMKALLNDGLDQRKADTNNDGEITLQEWLDYAVRRVPELYNSTGTKTAIQGWKSAPQPTINGQGFRGEKPQIPALFAFPKSSSALQTNVVLVRKTGNG